MVVCTVLLSQHSSRDLLYVKCLCVLPCYLSTAVEICYMLNVCVYCPVISVHSSRDMLYVKCLCVPSCYLSTAVEICYMLNVCVLSCYLSTAVEICYMLNVFVLSCYLTPAVEIWFILRDIHVPHINKVYTEMFLRNDKIKRLIYFYLFII